VQTLLSSTPPNSLNVQIQKSAIVVLKNWKKGKETIKNE